MTAARRIDDSARLAGMEDVESEAPLGLIRGLSTSFRQSGIQFCHWKSNAAISLSEAGINDLDILVAEGDVPRAHSALQELGFAAASVPSDRKVPGLTDYFGLDPGSGRLVQVQLHEWLVLGDDMTKNFRLPVESALLRSARTDGRVLPVPDPGLEYIVFVLRMAIKHCPLDAVLMGKGRLTPSERDELQFLEASLDDETVDSVLEVEFPWLERHGLEHLRRGLDQGAGIAVRASSGRRVLRLLAPFRRRSRPVDFSLRVVRRVTRKMERRVRPGTGPGYKRLARGGVVAFIGSDGAGKSTALQETFETLAGQFSVRRVHMGKPPRSFLSRLIRRLIRLIGLEVSAVSYTASPMPDRDPGAGLPMLNLMLARDRRRLARRARRLADSGWIVLSDRYPVPELSTMDSPRNGKLADKFPGSYKRTLARLEARIYRSLPEPDLRLVLKVSPEVAVSRREDQSPDFVTMRASEVNTVEWDRAVVLDADSSRQKLRDEAVGTVWRFLTGDERGVRET